MELVCRPRRLLAIGSLAHDQLPAWPQGYIPVNDLARSAALIPIGDQAVAGRKGTAAAAVLEIFIWRQANRFVKITAV